MTDTRQQAWRTNEQVAGARDAVRRAVMETDGNPHAAELWDALDDLCDAVTAAQPAPASGGEPDAWRNDPKAVAAIGHLRAQGCCMEDYGAMGLEEVVMNGRKDYDRLLETLCEVVASAVRRHPPASGTGSEDTERALKAIEKACGIIELGDQRLLAADGPAGGQPPELSLAEWRTLYVTLDNARKALKRHDAAPSKGRRT